MITQSTNGEKEPPILLEAALQYAQQGWRVLLLNGKAPLTRHGYKDGTTDPAQIRQWWREYSDAWIGIVVGPDSGLCVLDVDPRSGGDQRLAELIARYGPLPRTPVVATAGNGMHYYFQYHEQAKRSTIARGLEVKARDGYVVAPPSGSDDRGYTWKTAKDLPLAELPSWLRGRTPIIARAGAAPGDLGPILEGERNSVLTSLAGTLQRSDVSETTLRAILLGENRARCVPPLPDDEVERIARSISRYPAGGATRSTSRMPSWPAPLSDAALHGLAGDFVRLVSPHTEADPVALLVQLLIGFGNVIGRSAHFGVEADHHYTNEFAVLVGESSKARKGTSAGHVRKVLRAVDQAWTDVRQQSGLSSGEGLIWTVRDRIMARSAIRQKGRVTGYEDVEEDPGVSDKRLLVYEPEFASTLRVMERDGSTLSPTIRQAWDSGNLRILTKKSPAVATGAHISMICHVTRDELRRYLGRTEAGNGFANRFLWLCVRRSKVLSRGGRLNEADLEPLLDRLRQAVEWARSREELKCNEEAWALWDEVYESLSEGKPGLLGAVTSRAEAHVMRLGLLYALLDGASQIGHRHLEAALSLWRYSEDSAVYIFGDAIGDPIADALLAALRAHPQGLTDTEISTVVFGRNRPANEIARAKNVLSARGLIYCDQEETAGRTAQRWFAAGSTKETKESASTDDPHSSNSSLRGERVANNDVPDLSASPLDQASREDLPSSHSSISSSTDGPASEEVTWMA